MRIPGSDLVYFHFYILIFPFFFLDVPLLQKRATSKMWLESSVFGIEKEAEIWMSHFWVPNFDLYSNGAADRTWTGTVLPPRDFKSLASADFATAAPNKDKNYYSARTLRLSRTKSSVAFCYALGPLGEYFLREGRSISVQGEHRR